MSIQIFFELLSYIDVETLLRCFYANCNWKLTSCLTNISLSQNQCCLLLQNHNRLPIPPSAIYAQNHLEMIKCKTFATLHETTECNLMCRISKTGWKLPVVSHKGYDGHLIVKALKSEFGKVKVIPQNMENYLSLTVGQLKFIDSFQFTPQTCKDS